MTSPTNSNSRFSAPLPDRNLLISAATTAIALAAFPLLLTLPWQTDHAMQLATLLPALCILLASKRLAVPTTPSRLGILLATALLGALISTFTAPQTARSAVALSGFLWTCSAVWIGWRLSSNPITLQLLLAAITTGSAIGMIALKFRLVTHTDGFPIYSHPRIFGLHMFAGAIAGFGWLQTEQASIVRRRSAIGLTLAAWTGLAWSGSRAPALGLAVALAIGFCFNNVSDKRRRFVTQTIFLAVTSLALSFLLGASRPGMGWWTALRRTAHAADIDGLSSHRLQIWSAVWHKILEAPLLGWGGDAYLFIHPRLGGDQPHNFLLQWLHERGLVGTLPLLCMLAWCLLLALRKGDPDKPISPIRRWAGAGLAGATVCALFDGVFYHVIIALPVFLMAGLCIPPATAKSKQTPDSPMTRDLAAATLMISALMLVLHNGLALALRHTLPATPQAPVARVLRIFPSTTFGLWRWLGAWAHEQPDTTLEWSTWAQTHSISPAWFYLYSAKLYWEKGDLTHAQDEVDAGLAVATFTQEKAELLRLRGMLENVGRNN